MFKDRLAAAAHGVQKLLDQSLVATPGNLGEAMRHTTLGGKQLRAFLVLESARLHGIPENQALWPAAAIEAMHSYSLVHDDLPCMDNDSLRRGRPTVHVKWNEATAVLAGDALQALAFELTTHPSCSADPMVRAELAHSLATAAGGRGMVLGQTQDIAAENARTPLDLDAITGLQAHKTGALFQWAATAGPRMAHDDTTALLHFATALGLAFQIADDILDVEGDADKAGKGLQKDGAAGKATFVTLLGLQAAKQRAGDLKAEACAALEPYGAEGDTLRQAAQFVIARDI